MDRFVVGWVRRQFGDAAVLPGGYGRFVGRVGALAVALGVGAAVAAMPAVASADSTGSRGAAGSPEADTGSSESAPRSSARSGGHAQARQAASVSEPSARGRQVATSRTTALPGAAGSARPVADPGKATNRTALPSAAAPTLTAVEAAAAPGAPVLQAATAHTLTTGRPASVAIPLPEGSTSFPVIRTITSAIASVVATTPRPAPLAVMPSAVMTAAPLPSVTGSPAGAAGAERINPFDVVTAALALVSQEIERMVGRRSTASVATTALSGATVRPAATTSSTVAYSVVNDWGSGHTANMALTAGSGGLTKWTVEFDTPATIVNIWNGQITGQTGTHYVVSNMSYNGTVVAGQSTAFGYQASPGAAGSAPTNIKVNGVAVGSAAPATVPTVSVADASVTEGNSATTNAAFTVTLSKAATTQVTVGYATANGTATTGTDYTATTGILTFAPGATSQTVAVKVTGDTVVEPDETFSVKLANPSGATLSRAVATGTIKNDDAALPGVSIADVAVTEGNGEHAHFMFTVTMDKASTAPVTVRYATSDVTATAGADYVAASGTLSFAPGVVAQTVHVDIIGDTAVEPNETFKVTLSSPSGATATRAIATGTITNDDVVVVTPGLSISDASASESGSGGIASGYLRTSGNQIVDSQGKPVQLSSVNWFGAESTTLAPHGLWARGYKDMVDQMAAQGFNTIRLPYSSEMLHTTAKPTGIDFAQNPDLQGLTPLEVMDKVIAYAGQKGMRIVLDHHRSTAGAGTSENGLWYNSQYAEDRWVSDWQMLADRYQSNSTVIGFDLHNEPYNGTWGGGGATDWARAAERAGNAVLAVNPNLLIFTEGVGTYKGQSYWWGGNLMGVKDRPITLSVPNRVVYSPHDYPNSVWAQPWFQTADFGANLPNVFRQAWGYIYENNIAPIWVGEFGTKLQDPKDAVWFEAITSYLSGDFDNNGTIDIPAGTEDMSWAFWAWNPNSGDTGGILADDWRTVNQNKMAYLTPIEYTGGSGTSLASFAVTLAAPSSQAVAVQYATANGTATAATDYSAASGTLTFAPGETRKTITVVVKSDSLTEGNEEFRVTLSNPTGATLTDAIGIGTIIDRTTGATTSGAATIGTASTGTASTGTASTGTTTGGTTTGGGTGMPMPSAGGPYTDIMTFGMFHGSSHTGMDALEGGRTAITTEAVVAYNDLRRFAGFAPKTIEDVGRWAFANSLTNNAEAWGSDLQGVGLYYAMQGAKVGWIADDKYTPQIVADIERTARLGSADDVMAMVARYGHGGYAKYLMDNGYQTAFIDTLKMEPHYGGWMHDRANGRLIIDGAATAHDVNHLTILSHDQTRPFMNDTWDWPQWPALNVPHRKVIEYFQSMVALGDPRGTNLTALDAPKVAAVMA